MGDFATIQSVTDNIESVLKSLGIHFDRAVYETDADIPASLLPYGRIFYEGEIFEELSGERPSYIEANFTIRVTIGERDRRQMMMELQRWVHLVRDGLTVSALNIGDLASSKLISRVITENATTEVINNESVASVVYKLRIRYREA